MQIVVKKRVLEEMLDQVVREVSSFQSVRIDEIPAKIDEDDAIKPEEQMATQLSQQKPKVDDPNYKPVNTAELTKAAAAVAEKVPQDKTDFFYKGMKDLAQRASDKSPGQLSEDKMTQILSYLLDREVNVVEAKRSKDSEPIPSDVAVALKASGENTQQLMQQFGAEASSLPAAVGKKRLQPIVMGAVRSLIDKIAKAQGVEFKQAADFAPVKADLLKPGGIEVTRGAIKLNAMGIDKTDTGIKFNVANVSNKDVEDVVRQTIEQNFDDLAEYLATSHFLGDPTSGIKRFKKGTLATEAADKAKDVFAQLGSQLPDDSYVSPESFKDFVDELITFVTDDLSGTNTSFSFTFPDVSIKSKKVKKDGTSEDAVSQQVVIKFDDIGEILAKLPEEISAYGRSDMSVTGVTRVGERVKAAQRLKTELANEIENVKEEIVDKFSSSRARGFVAGSEGRNLASDLLRRFGGERSDIPAEKVHQMVTDVGREAGEEGVSPENIEKVQHAALTHYDVLSKGKLEMRRQLVDAFTGSFLDSAIFLAAKKFDDSAEVSKKFQAAADRQMMSLDGPQFDDLFDLYTTVLKMFGEKDSTNKLFRAYEKILSNPDFQSFVAEKGQTDVSDLSRATTALFDKDSTLIHILNLAAEFARKKLRQPALSQLFIGKTDDDQYNVASMFADECENMIESADSDPVVDKLINKLADIMDASGMGFVRKAPEKKKKADKMTEAALRSIIRNAIR
jgi:hypothetical protein